MSWKEASSKPSDPVGKLLYGLNEKLYFPKAGTKERGKDSGGRINKSVCGWDKPCVYGPKGDECSHVDHGWKVRPRRPWGTVRK